jgi:hypothetical protein
MRTTLALFGDAEHVVLIGSEEDWRRDSSSNWLILFTTSCAKVDLPEAGIPAIPTNRRLSGETLSEYDD